ncbi:hypothetical protein SNOG_01668 [Parastagonospora nodorum SN15]|uniref:Uncharacterized protein n=1 Tax=Phaeosphaeria nodorum (strain SN15 / ATCC MYA-4574 / FGSC 10173) TaxID=321614 RepID=Q0V2U6_PHANO|nr:hypothetical protein SNOG_01668 [Parastagonospora nodorum SN15]EAT91317.1 hypothetical protein SNOG_01668 [Parastagonospora nodorum SN15]
MIYKDGYKIRLILHDSQIRTLSRCLNGTEVEVCTLDYTARSHAPSTNGTTLTLSAFNLDRFSYRQDISRDTIRVSKTLLKEALANITISALTINKWYQLVNGTISYNYATYQFNNKFSFFPPYGLSQLLILPLVSGGHEDIPKELEKLKVRFAELLDDSGPPTQECLYSSIPWDLRIKMR